MLLLISVVGCSTVKPINKNCVVVSTKKVQERDITPSSGTGTGAVIGAGSGAVLGGIYGLAGGLDIGAGVYSIVTVTQKDDNQVESGAKVNLYFEKNMYHINRDVTVMTTSNKNESSVKY